MDSLFNIYFQTPANEKKAMQSDGFIEKTVIIIIIKGLI
jgi:hypothetical protein